MTSCATTSTPTRTIPIGARGQHVVVVEQQDYAYLTQWRWTFKTSRWRYGAKVYARRCIWVRDATAPRGGRNVTLYMHRIILTERMGLAPPSDTHQGDHIDVDSLNNTRANLRWSTRAEQNANQRPRITKAQKIAYAVAAAAPAGDAEAAS
jgi:HNH endonuclease